VPRVSEQHLAARRQQILDAAGACFVRNGFHTTSMQDVITEAGLSVGAVYRYFRSKNEIIEAIADSYSQQIGAVLETVTADPERPLIDVMRAAFEVMDANVGPDGALRIAVQVWAESVRDERVAAIANRLIQRFRDVFIGVAKDAIARGELPAKTDPMAAGAALFALALGYGLQKLLTASPARETYLAGVRALLGSPSGDRP
jgi:AcrR family transcriptional regulator